MKVILYMATSINGYITRGSDDTDWVSDIDWQEFDRLKRESKVIIMGSNTYEQFSEDFPQEGALNIVMTHNSKLLSKVVENALFTDRTPTEVVELAKEKGFSQLMLIGGMKLNTSFLKDKLIDEIWLDIHPIIIGKGKTVFDKIDLVNNIELFDSKDLGGGNTLLKFKLNK